MTKLPNQSQQNVLYKQNGHIYICPFCTYGVVLKGPLMHGCVGCRLNFTLILFVSIRQVQSKIGIDILGNKRPSTNQVQTFTLEPIHHTVINKKLSKFISAAS